MVEQRHFEDVQTNDELPPVVESADELRMFFFSAATNNGHRIHYDLPYAQSEGHPALLVHGPLQAAWMGKYVTDWAGPDGHLVRFAIQNRGSAYPRQPLTFSGRVVGKREEDGRGLVDLELVETNPEGAVLMPGSATVSLPRRA